MKRKNIFATLIVAAIAGICVMASCSKEEEKPADSATSNSAQIKLKNLNLVVEKQTDNTYERVELLDLGSVYESYWNTRYFENGLFRYDVNYTTNVLDTRFAVISIDHDKVTIETEDGDTVTFFNIVSLGKTVTFDMLRDDSSKVHFKFTTGEDIDFVKELQSIIETNNTKVAITIGTVCAIVGAVAGVTAATVSIISYVRAERARKCETIKANGIEECASYKCGAWRGDCCVRCTGGNANPYCNHIGDVIGEGTDCNN